jgi:GntR family transcriptional regulator/MocR family aminotransferase
MTMSLERRQELIAWARRSGAWIIEDDYLSELQLTGRAAPALASLEHGGRVLHLGSFSKTISPALRLGFLVAPLELTARLGDVAACLAPAPSAAVQGAVAEFLRGGHYLRHLRRMKRLYAAQRQRLLECLAQIGPKPLKVEKTAGMAVVVSLPPSTSDVDISRRALAAGLAPGPLSPWYARPPAQQGLLLGVTNLGGSRLPDLCRQLADLSR